MLGLTPHPRFGPTGTPPKLGCGHVHKICNISETIQHTAPRLYYDGLIGSRTCVQNITDRWLVGSLANFVSKFPNFRHHGNKGRSF